MPSRNFFAERLRNAHLSPSRPNEFDISPDSGARARIAADMDLLTLHELRFYGNIQASGADDWALSAKLTARIVQPCSITLEPVETTINEDISLIFSPHITAPDAEEVEMGDDSIEPLGQWIELSTIALEALALALPLHPLAPGAEMPDFAHDSDYEMDAESHKPFAGLADLIKKNP